MAGNETYKVGDTVYGDFGRYSRVDVREGVVAKVTPSGRVNVDFGNLKSIQFKNGRQVGGDRLYRYRLIGRETYDRLVAKQAAQQAVSALNTRIRGWGYTTKAEAIAFADEIRVLAEAIPDDYTA